MFSSIDRTTCAGKVRLGAAAWGLASTLLAASPASAQISLGLDTGLLPNAVCVGSTGGTTVFVSSSADCATAAGGVNAPYLQVGPDTSYALFNATTGASTFTGPVTVQNDADFNGQTDFTDVVSFTGPNATFATTTTFTFGSTFQAAATFNGTTNFTAGMTTANITNSGTINSNNVNVTGSLTAAPSTTINFGGVNRVQGVAAGINALDAVNVAQLNAATSGITTDVTAIQAVNATQTTQITTLQGSVGTLQTDLAATTATVGTQATQISALQAADATFNTRISGLESSVLDFAQELDDVDDRAAAGTATAVALSGAMFLPGKSFNLTGNVGAYRGAVAGAMQLGAIVSPNAAINAGIAHGFNKGGKTAIRAGFTFGW